MHVSIRWTRTGTDVLWSLLTCGWLICVGCTSHAPKSGATAGGASAKTDRSGLQAGREGDDGGSAREAGKPAGARAGKPGDSGGRAGGTASAGESGIVSRDAGKSGAGHGGASGAKSGAG